MCNQLFIYVDKFFDDGSSALVMKRGLKDLNHPKADAGDPSLLLTETQRNSWLSLTAFFPPA